MKTFFSYILALLGDLCNSLIDAFTKKKGFNASFGNETNIATRFNKGFLISKHRKLTRRKSFENILLSGPTGSGKTTRLLLKNLYTLKNCSLIINDPSKELFLLASGYLSQHFCILTLNFSDSTISSGFNILSRIRKPNDVNKVAHLLVAASLDKGTAGDPFWSLQSKTLLQIFIRLALHQPEEYRNMANVLHITNHFAAQPKKVDFWIAKTGDVKLILDYKALISMPEKTLQNIVASAKAALQLFDDPEIAQTTAHDSIDFDQLRAQPTIIFLHNSVSEQKYLSTLNSIFFEQLYGHVLQRLPKKHELDLFLILEEASSLYVPLLPLALANCRKHRVGNFVCVQSPGQLKTMYKDEADNIAANCVTKIYLPGQTSMEVLRDLEALSGKCIYIDDKKQERVKQLLTVDEIRLLPENRTLILSGNNPFIKGRTSPYYKSFAYKGYAKIPPVPLYGDFPDEPIVLLQ
jgi:type IV secretion system protein VirD4